MIKKVNLKECYVDATQKLIPFTKKARTNKKIKLATITNLFTQALWEQKKTKSGHVKFQHRVTGVVVEFQGHIKGSDNVINPAIQEQILNQVQLHLNILCNYIYNYSVNHWKVEPNYNEALLNFMEWSKTKPMPPI